MCIALLRVSVGFVPARKEEEEGGYDAPSLLCFETNNNMVARKEEEERGYDAPSLLCFETNNNMASTM
jgi:hypothetical protein